MKQTFGACLLLLLLLGGQPAWADAWSPWFTIDAVYTGVGDVLAIEGTDLNGNSATHSIGCTNSHVFVVDPSHASSENHADAKKMLMAAFLSGKVVQSFGKTDKCSANGNLVVHFRICVDGTSCGQ